MSIDFASRLNAAQLAAVTAPDGPALVIAAAGTGKTRTLTHRLAWLALERGVDPRHVLLLTFTNRAAREMLDRAGQLIGGGVGGLWGGTFHHAANRMLRRAADSIGYGNDYTILDDDDSSRLLKQCISELGLKDKKFPKAEVLGGVFGLAANRAANVADTVAEHFNGHTVDVEAVLRVFNLYTEKKHALNAMDFDDLLSNGLRLLRENERVRAFYQRHFQHVLVDEYQDTNCIQAEFVDLIAAGHGNLMAVGDDFQSIYSWRGADIRNMLDFEKSHPGARVFKLEDNYRSVPGVLEVANRVIAGNPQQYQKTLRPTRPADVRPILASLADGNHQARYVVEKIQTLLQSGAASPNEIAVLYRSHFHAMELQLELTRARLDYVVVSGVRFFEQAHIKDVCTLPRLAANPADSLAFARLVEMLPRVGPRKAQKLWDDLGGYFNLRDASKRAQLAAALPPEAQTEWKAIETRLFSEPPAPPTRRKKAGDDATVAPVATTPADVLDRPDELVYRFVDAFYGEYAAGLFENVQNRLEDIEELQNFSSKYANTAEFLSEMALLTNLDARQDKNAAQTANGIRLTTVHQAKGLEWKAVFVLWLVDGMFPSTRSLEVADNEAEERRLFYVAVTRAKDYLWLCSPRMRKSRDGGSMMCPASRFVEDIDPLLLQLDKPAPPAWNPGNRWGRW